MRRKSTPYEPVKAKMVCEGVPREGQWSQREAKGGQKTLHTWVYKLKWVAKGSRGRPNEAQKDPILACKGENDRRRNLNEAKKHPILACKG